MELTEVTSTAVTARLSAGELLIMANALNEVCNALEVPEFATRIGAERPQVLRLLNEVGAAYDKLALPSS